MVFLHVFFFFFGKLFSEKGGIVFLTKDKKKGGSID